MGRTIGNTHQYQNRKREPFGAINSTRFLPVPLGPAQYLDHIFIRLGGSLVISAGTTSGTSLGENPGGLINRFRVNASSKGVYPGGEMKNLESMSVIRQRIFDSGRATLDTALTGAAGTFTLDQPFWLQFARPKSPRPYDTVLPLQEYQGLEVQVDVGGRDSQFVGNDRTFDFTGAYLEYSDYRELQVEGDPVKHVFYENDNILLIGAANQRLNYDQFAVGENLLDILVMTRTTNRALADTIMNKATLIYGTPFYIAFSQELKHQMKEEVSETVQSLVGLYHLRFNKDRLVYGAIPHRTRDDFRAEFDVANPGGANIDQLLVSTDRVLWPEDFGKASQ